MTADLASATAETKHSELGWRNYAIVVAYIVNAAFTFASSFGAFGPDNTELSFKYTLLLTPAGFAFAIWGPIFIWEGVFAALQLLPQFRGSKIVELATPGWIVACISQSAWSVVFAQELLLFACVCMLGILAGLVSIAVLTDGLAMTWSEYFALRAPISLHMGWIIAASALNVNVVAGGARASPETLLGMAVASIGVICVLAAIFALVMKSADPIVCFVAAWAFNAISAQLSDPVDLNAPNRHNPHTWDEITLKGLEIAASYIAILALVLGAIASARVLLAAAYHNTDTKRASVGKGPSATELMAQEA